MIWFPGAECGGFSSESIHLWPNVCSACTLTYNIILIYDIAIRILGQGHSYNVCEILFSSVKEANSLVKCLVFSLRKVVIKARVWQKMLSYFLIFIHSEQLLNPIHPSSSQSKWMKKTFLRLKKEIEIRKTVNFTLTIVKMLHWANMLSVH